MLRLDSSAATAGSYRNHGEPFRRRCGVRGKGAGDHQPRPNPKSVVVDSYVTRRSRSTEPASRRRRRHTRPTSSPRSRRPDLQDGPEESRIARVTVLALAGVAVVQRRVWGASAFDWVLAKATDGRRASSAGWTPRSDDRDRVATSPSSPSRRRLREPAPPGEPTV